MYFALFQIPYPDDPGRAVGITAGFFLVQGLYFIVVVAVVTRIRSRKPRALLVAAVAVVLDTLFTWLTGILLVVVIQVLMSFVYAPVWGIARRQHRKWMIGLALGVVIVAVYVPFVFGLTVDGPAAVGLVDAQRRQLRRRVPGLLGLRRRRAAARSHVTRDAVIPTRSAHECN